MLSNIRTIRVQDVLWMGQLMMIIITPLLAVVSHASLISYYTLAEFVFVVSALGNACLMRSGYQTEKWWWAIVSLDIAVVTLIVWTHTGTEAWLLYVWCVIEAALSLRSKVAFFVTAVIDILSILDILSWYHGDHTVLVPIVNLLVFNLQAFPIIFVTYWEMRRRVELEQRLHEVTIQTTRVRELENITKQMTDYTMDVQNRAVIDQLTGLYNQTYFHHRLLIEVEKARQAGSMLSLVLCDIDHFKTFNDRFGHYLGDDVLRAITKVILDSVQDTFWIAGRIGGEEMVIAMPDVPLEQAQEFGESLRQKIADTVVPGPSGPLRVTISAGVATFPETANDAQELTKHADQAMYRAKDSGRNRVCVYTNFANTIA